MRGFQSVVSSSYLSSLPSQQINRTEQHIMAIIFLLVDGRILRNETESDWDNTLYIYKTLYSRHGRSAFEVGLPRGMTLQNVRAYLTSGVFMGSGNPDTNDYTIEMLENWDIFREESLQGRYTAAQIEIIRAEAEELDRRLAKEGWKAEKLDRRPAEEVFEPAKLASK